MVTFPTYTVPRFCQSCLKLPSTTSHIIECEDCGPILKSNINILGFLFVQLSTSCFICQDCSQQQSHYVCLISQGTEITGNWDRDPNFGCRGKNNICQKIFQLIGLWGRFTFILVKFYDSAWRNLVVLIRKKYTGLSSETEITSNWDRGQNLGSKGKKSVYVRIISTQLDFEGFYFHTCEILEPNMMKLLSFDKKKMHQLCTG